MQIRINSSTNYKHLITHINELVTKGDKVKYIDTLRNLVKVCESFSYDKSIRVLCNLVESLMSIPNMFEIRMENFNYNNYNSVYEKLTSIENKIELIEWFISLYENIHNQLDNINYIKTYEIIQKAKEYLEDNYSDSMISANVLAEYLKIIPQYFSKIFNEYTKTSFPDYISNIRLKKAKELLQSTQMPINDIYKKVGYNSRNYFTSAFKNKYGVSPSRIRNR